MDKTLATLWKGKYLHKNKQKHIKCNNNINNIFKRIKGPSNSFVEYSQRNEEGG